MNLCLLRVASTFGSALYMQIIHSFSESFALFLSLFLKHTMLQAISLHRALERETK